MASAFYSAGFKVYDITSNDLNNNQIYYVILMD